MKNLRIKYKSQLALCVILLPMLLITGCKPKKALPPPPVANTPGFLDDTLATTNYTPVSQGTDFNATTLTLQTKGPFLKDKKPVVNYEEIQSYYLWQNKILVYFVQAQNKTRTQAKVSEFKLVIPVPQEFWDNAESIKKTAITPNRNNTEAPLDMELHWRDASRTLKKYIRSVNELPIMVPVLENKFKKLLAEKGVNASVAYPKRSYIGFRWYPANKNNPEHQELKYYKLNQKFEDYIAAKMQDMPAYLPQIEPRENFNTEILEMKGTKLASYGLILSNNDQIIIEVFELP
jgi:hypothetical protein